MSSWRERWRPSRRPTLLLRCILLISAELAVNAILWVVAAIVFRHRTRFLTLSLLAWTLGLRHALDADHISVIDNATRRIVSLHYTVVTGTRPRRPVTCGLWFSLGHSTIVVAVICAIAISLGIVDRLGKISSVGGIVGAAVSGSTLFLFAIVNSILLYSSVSATRKHRAQSGSPTEEQDKATSDARLDDVEGKQPQNEDHRFRGIFTRLAYPLFRLVDRPYKLYPIGVLFGLGFDTASSIALLGIAGATNSQVQDTSLDTNQAILPGDSANRSDASIVLLALLFTAGMTLVDSLDSVLMVNAYAPGELLAPRRQDEDGQATSRLAWLGRLRFFEDASPPTPTNMNLDATPHEKKDELLEPHNSSLPEHDPTNEEHLTGRGTSSTLSHLLTLLSILLAFAISIITLLGLIGENCDRCARAAAKQDETRNGGLEGRWWLFWQRANDASGIIGACIVGGFAALLVLWYGGRALLRRYGASK
ncbi:Nickel/cobalt transporter, high-affinity [Kalmanozyma brasiliensis GHG001]|uniref:Nickel/cobalt transporter, high-affinity n=1 Tax=Kalmanozyma brasiliensis (strain GHG001) TaxID=1365824 RepID=UPI00286809E2|nr:Nickel/cobalt transporter, high-affinity [Kalmanozyma brasiliensis GHG001]KAF6766911.1 Nickel/cobalt transporter, high-affinity [Kalmanozyma brasiliensis GHG001]